VVAVSTSDPPQGDTIYQNKQIDKNAEQERDGPSDVFGAGQACLGSTTTNKKYPNHDRQLEQAPGICLDGDDQIVCIARS
jgi:hypothetical protein